MVKILDVEKAAQDAVAEELQYPKLGKDGRYNTMNDQGAMFPEMTQIALDFIRIAKKRAAKVLEIGPAYGNVCLEALKKGARDYTVVEKGEEHLKIFALQLKQEFPSFVENSKLTLIQGCFPNADVIDHLAPGQYDAILCQNVFHFLTDYEVKEALYQCYRLLKSSGKLFACCSTPYVGVLRQEIREKFEADLYLFKSRIADYENCGHFLEKTVKVPGYLPNFPDALNMDELRVKNYSPKDLAATDKHAFLFHPETVEYMLHREGLNVERMEYLPLPGMFYLDGRELLQFVACKSPSFFSYYDRTT